MWISLTSSPISVPNIESQRWDVSFKYERTRSARNHSRSNRVSLFALEYTWHCSLAFRRRNASERVRCIPTEKARCDLNASDAVFLPFLDGENKTICRLVAWFKDTRVIQNRSGYRISPRGGRAVTDWHLNAIEWCISVPGVGARPSAHPPDPRLQKSVPVGRVGRSVGRESCLSVGSLKLIQLSYSAGTLSSPDLTWMLKVRFAKLNCSDIAWKVVRKGLLIAHQCLQGPISTRFRIRENVCNFAFKNVKIRHSRSRVVGNLRRPPKTCHSSSESWENGDSEYVIRYAGEIRPF